VHWEQFIKLLPIFLCFVNRHVYKPLQHHGYDKWQARLAAFLLSACFCEVGHSSSCPAHSRDLSFT